MMVKIISSGGGDVLKFAGDAMIVLWPPDKTEHVNMRLRRAAQCALYIQQKLDQVEILVDSVKHDVEHDLTIINTFISFLPPPARSTLRRPPLPRPLTPVSLKLKPQPYSSTSTYACVPQS